MKLSSLKNAMNAAEFAVEFFLRLQLLSFNDKSWFNFWIVATDVNLISAKVRGVTILYSLMLSVPKEAPPIKNCFAKGPKASFVPKFRY